MKVISHIVWRILRQSCIISALALPLTAADPAATSTTPPLSDKLLGREIHNAIVSDPTLPYCAHIVSVRVQDGVVTLKGHVHNKVEKETLKKKAASLAGRENVVSDIHYFGERNIQ